MDAAAVAGWVVGALAVLAFLGVVVALVTDDREPTIVLAWLFVILLLPVLGIVAYFFVGRDHRRRDATQARAREAELVRRRGA